jgi:hypothetical protein
VTLADWANVGELLGGFGVVVSLFYLALQIRQNTRQIHEQTSATRFETMRALGDNMQNLVLQLSEHPESMRVYRQGLRDLESLDDDGRWRFGAIMSNAFSNFYMSWRAQQMGLAIAEDAKRFEVGTWSIARRPGAQQWWQQARDGFPADFQSYVEELMRRPRPPGRDSERA